MYSLENFGNLIMSFKSHSSQNQIGFITDKTDDQFIQSNYRLKSKDEIIARESHWNTLNKKTK